MPPAHPAVHTLSAGFAWCTPLQVLCLLLQSVTEDPTAYLEAVKRRVQDKEGVPVRHQRLVFAVPAASDPSASQLPPVKAAAEELLAELSSWQVCQDCGCKCDMRAACKHIDQCELLSTRVQVSSLCLPLRTSAACAQAILYQDGRAIGRLVTPQVLKTSSYQLPSTSLSAKVGVPVELISIKFDRWQPSSQKQNPVSLAPSLSIACDTPFLSSSYRLQVFGHGAEGSFAFPQQYEFSGQTVRAALNYHSQRNNYIKHQQLRHSLLSAGRRGSNSSRDSECSEAAAEDEEITVELGESSFLS